MTGCDIVDVAGAEPQPVAAFSVVLFAMAVSFLLFRLTEKRRAR